VRRAKTSASVRHTDIGFLLVALAGCSCASQVVRDGSLGRSRHLDASSFGRYRAVVIGNGEYQSHSQIESAVADAETLKDILERDYGYEVQLLRNATHAEMTEAFARLGDLSEVDALLIYFSGHGAPASSGGAGYWLPTDARPLSNLELSAPPATAVHDARWIARDHVIQQVATIRSSHVLVVDDSCFSGAAKNVNDHVAMIATAGAGSAPPTTERQQDRANLSRFAIGRAQATALTAAEGDPTKLAFRRTRRWLSAGGNELVRAGDGVRRVSLFTKYFLDVLRDNEGVMDGNELFGIVRRRMSSNLDPQVPEYYPIAKARDDGGDFLLIKRTWSIDEVDVGLGKVVVRIVGSVSNREAGKDEEVKKLVLNQLANAPRPQIADSRPRHLLLVISYPEPNELVMTLIDREQDEILGRVAQVLSTHPEQLVTNVESAVLNLRNIAEHELESKAISVDIVERALVAQRRHDWEFYLTSGVGAYIDFDGDGWLNEPAASFLLGGHRTVLPWLLFGASFGYDTTRAKSSHNSFIGDLDDGTYADNKLVGQLAMQTGTAMLTATVRRSHGLVLPFAYVAAGIAYHDLALGDEHYVPTSTSDTLPIALVNRRKSTSDWAPAVGGGAGLNFLLDEHWSIVGRAHLFKSFHGMKVHSRIEGFSQTKEVIVDFQAIQGVSVEAGIALLL
jgi:hypothetical protein